MYLRDPAVIISLMLKQLFTFAKYSVVSLSTTGLDYLLFALFRTVLGLPLYFAVFVARAISSFTNFLLNMKVVFKGGDKFSILKYYALAAVIAVLSYSGIRLLSHIGLNEYLSKLISDTALFIVSYTVQHKLIFKKPVPNTPPQDDESPLKAPED